MKEHPGVRRAEAGDIHDLTTLMEEFYAESGYELDQARARAAFATLVGNGELGMVFLCGRGDRTAGYIVACRRFAMGNYGYVCSIEDLFVRPEFRNMGVATGLMDAVAEAARAGGMTVLTVEVGRTNAVATGLYRRRGFAPRSPDIVTMETGGA